MKRRTPKTKEEKLKKEWATATNVLGGISGQKYGMTGARGRRNKKWRIAERERAAFGGELDQW